VGGSEVEIKAGCIDRRRTHHLHAATSKCNLAQQFKPAPAPIACTTRVPASMSNTASVTLLVQIRFV
jgi:hypothetical protein